ncbi:MAG: baseplate J/gp47 family protein [Thermomicrobium sp.]|nr:baseplate J/gp47 family protein [Thermomicrobium sp.]
MRSIRWVLRICAALLATASIVLAAAVTVPSATVHITPIVRERKLSLTYGIAEGNVDWTVPTRRVTTVVRVEAERDATGEKQVPDGFASGVVRFVNAATEAAAIPAGTELSGANSVRYRLTTDIVVPAADPFGTQAFGVAEAPVVATVPGPVGNAEVGTVSGRLATQILYRNVAAITGGTVRTVRFVTKADLEALREDVERALRERIRSALQGALREGEVLIDDSIRLGSLDVEFSQPENAESDRVVARGTLTVSALTYAPEAVHRAAQEEAARRLARSTQGDEVFLGNTLRFGEPEAIGANTWRVEATAQVRVVPPETELRAVREEIAGEGVGEALARLRSIPGVAAVQIQVWPSWWPARLPDRASRIQVVVDD